MPKPKPADEPFDISKAVRMLLDIASAVDRGVPPSVVWGDIYADRPRYAKELTAYTTVEQVAEALTGIADQMATLPGTEAQAKTINELATKILGPKRSWADDFIKVVQKAKI